MWLSQPGKHEWSLWSITLPQILGVDEEENQEVATVFTERTVLGVPGLGSG